MDRAYLVLEDGQIFQGTRFGAPVNAIGELVFTTGMGGYIETLSDPSYYGQITIQTFPLIGNYGWISEDAESGNCFMKGYILREWCPTPSNFRSEGDLDALLKRQGVPGLCGVDTRALTRRLREHGVMNAAITDKPEEALQSLAGYRVQNALAAVSCSAPYTVGEGSLRVALLDYGTKRSILRNLVKRDCRVTVFPYDTPAQTILDGGFDGLVLSNGPGDPADNPYCIEQLRLLLGKLPLFGVCLGHQLLALAAGASTFKLKYGHRGANQPVEDLHNGHILITCQNHGYAVDKSTLPACARLRFVNVNDGTCEGVEYPAYRALSAQYHPEACAGPLDAVGLFDEFIQRIREGKANAAQS